MRASVVLPAAAVTRERARGVDRGGVDRVALGLFHRQAFTGDGRLVHGRAAATISPSAAAFAGPHARCRLAAIARPAPLATCRRAAGAWRSRARSSRPRMALRARSSERASISSATLNRNVAGAIERTRLDQLGHVEQEHHHGRPGHWPISTAPVTASAHQGVDVEIAVAHGDPALAVGVQAAGQDGGHGQRGGDVTDQPAK